MEPEVGKILEGKVTSILKLYSALQGTDVVTQVKFTCWTVARQYNLSHFLTILLF